MRRGLVCPPEIHVFIIWSKARREERRILADLAANFRVLDQIEVTWTPGETFARNLSRMYGDTLPPESDKELHCGTGSFLAVIVEDPHPRYGVRRTNRGRRVLNSTVFDSRRRHRAWTGEGYRVHASDSPVEAERNLVLLFGEGAAEFRLRGVRTDVPRQLVMDPVGTHGWDSVDQLLRALQAYGCRIPRGAAAGRAGADGQLSLRAQDAWWAERIAGGREIVPGTRQVQVDDGYMRLTFTQQAGARARSLIDAVGPVVRAVLCRA